MESEMCKHYSNNKEINRMVRELLRDGWKFETRTKHKKVISPNGRTIVISGSPSDQNAHRQFERDIRRVLA
jgi:predicted RNA binding protein YcfA (HicA-like mRNA interferase family)